MILLHYIIDCLKVSCWEHEILFDGEEPTRRPDADHWAK